MAFFWIIFTLGIVTSLYSIFYLFPGPFFDFALRAQYRKAGLIKRSIEIDGHKISYLVGGQGPPLVLLHGFGADKHHWPPVINKLSGHFTVYAPDLPGFGESTQVETASYKPSEQVERVRAFVEALNLGKVHMGGNSMGGYFAGIYAAQYPDSVESLWLLAPAGVLSAEHTEAIRRLENGHNPLLIDSYAAYDQLTSLCFFKPPFIPRPFRRCICVRAIENQKFFAKLFSDFTDDMQALEELLRGSSVPTLIVWGENDQLLHPSGAAKLAEALENAEVVMMAKMGHIPMLERPLETEQLYMNFHQLRP